VFVATLLQIILECVDGQLEQMNSNDCPVQPGHNGPYHDPETPVRNTGHWLITFSHTFEWTGDEKFRDAARRCADYLLSEPARPHGFSFHHRDQAGKDRCNGLIGQAWTFEALAEVSCLLGDPQYARLAEEVFFQHPFNEELGLWKRLEIDGRVLSEDPVFNHQLWFAACASLIAADARGEIRGRVTCFLDRLPANVTVLAGGLIYQIIQHLFEKDLDQKFTLGTRAKQLARKCLHAFKGLRFPERSPTKAETRVEYGRKWAYKSVGYHAFNMYAFALLKQQIPGHSFWTTDRFREMIAYMRTDEYWQALEDNRYGYPYNPPGFEVPYSLVVLGDLDRDQLIEVTRRWAGEQFRRCFNPQTGKMDRNTEDPETHTARLYELVRLPKEILEAVEIDFP